MTEATKLQGAHEPITDFVWRQGAGPLDARALGALGVDDLGDLWGQFALHVRDGQGSHLLARDRLGVNKLFFATTDANEVVSANYLVDLRRRGHALRDIWSVPAGHAIQLAPARNEYRLFRHAELAYGEEPGAPRDVLVEGIRDALTTTFERLAVLLRGRRLFVTLSGGLDSTVIALMARQHLGAFTAVTFAVDEESPGSDLGFARIVADSLGVPLEVVRPSADDIVALLDDVLVQGQDWRDFNVHCGLVNAAIARHLHHHGGQPATPRPVVLTGDAMNELVADYVPVVHRGVRHYELPRVEPGILRRFLVTGLDSGDREVGIFGAQGIDVVQPYALAAEAYVALPGSQLGMPGVKAELVHALMGSKVPSAIYERPKVRAQVGSSDHVGGTLAVLLERGIDTAWLERRFASLLDADADERRQLIRAGMYRFTPQAPWQRAP